MSVVSFLSTASINTGSDVIVTIMLIFLLWLKYYGIVEEVGALNWLNRMSYPGRVGVSVFIQKCCSACHCKNLN